MIYEKRIAIPCPTKEINYCAETDKILEKQKDCCSTIRSITATKKSYLKDSVQGSFSPSDLKEVKNV